MPKNGGGTVPPASVIRCPARVFVQRQPARRQAAGEIDRRVFTERGPLAIILCESLTRRLDTASDRRAGVALQSPVAEAWALGACVCGGRPRRQIVSRVLPGRRGCLKPERRG